MEKLQLIYQVSTGCLLLTRNFLFLMQRSRLAHTAINLLLMKQFIDIIRLPLITTLILIFLLSILKWFQFFRLVKLKFCLLYLGVRRMKNIQCFLLVISSMRNVFLFLSSFSLFCHKNVHFLPFFVQWFNRLFVCLVFSLKNEYDREKETRSKYFSQVKRLIIC